MSDVRATSFGSEADTYEASRPDYPFEAVAWMLEKLPHGARRIADVGAGTGKLTRVIADAPDAQVVAVDPDAAMLAKLRDTVPGVPTYVGTAESLPLPDASLDAVVLGQAWHWVDPETASAEIGRVVRPGGTLGLIWNRRDDRVDWIVNLTEVMGSAEVEVMDMDAVEIGPPFGPTESFVTDWARPMDVDLLVDMAASRSYVITATPRRRREILDGVRQVVEGDPHLGTEFDLPYRTFCYKAALPG